MQGKSTGASRTQRHQAEVGFGHSEIVNWRHSEDPEFESLCRAAKAAVENLAAAGIELPGDAAKASDGVGAKAVLGPQACE